MLAKDTALMSDGYLDNYVVSGITLEFEGNTRFLLSTYKGETIVTDFLCREGFTMNQVIFPSLYANISDFDYQDGDNILAIGTTKGEIITYRVADPSALLDDFNFMLIEKYNCTDNPHGDLDQTQEEREATQMIYNHLKSHIVKVRFSRVMRGNYFYVLESLQYIYIRNYSLRQVLKEHNLY